MHHLGLPAIGLLASLATSEPALAHAFLQSATPAVGSTVPTAPAQIAIDYTEGVEPKFSTIEVRDAAGARVDTGKMQAAANGRELTVALKPLPPGSYQVTWRVTATDTHKTEGSYTFTVTP